MNVKEEEEERTRRTHMHTHSSNLITSMAISVASPHLHPLWDHGSSPRAMVGAHFISSSNLHLGALDFSRCEGKTHRLPHLIPPLLAQDGPSTIIPENLDVDSTQPEKISGESSLVYVPISVLMYDHDPDVDDLAFALQECNDSMDLLGGEYIHAHIISCGHDSDRYLSNLLILLYGKCGSIESAECVFHKILSPNVYSWNILINAYVRNDELHKAKIAFDSMTRRNVASWNAIISALAQSGDGRDALTYYHKMLDEGIEPDPITFASAIDACAGISSLEDGLKIHSSLVEYGFISNMIVVTALINMYGQCGHLDIANGLFQVLPYHDVLSWSAMIASYVKNESYKEAFVVFQQMLKSGIHPSRATFLAILDACSNLGDVSIGYDLHALILSEHMEFDIVIDNALINMYGKCRSLSDAIFVFCKMLERDVVTWTSIIYAHAINDQGKKALELFYVMQAESIEPNNITLSVILDACASMHALSEGLLIHRYSVCRGIDTDFITRINLINMYGKFRMLDEAKAVFDSLVEPDTVAWNAILSACVQNDSYVDAAILFRRMKSTGGTPNPYTLAILQGAGS